MGEVGVFWKERVVRAFQTEKITGSWHVLGSARTWKYLKHRVCVEAVVREGPREMDSGQGMRDRGCHTKNLGNCKLGLMYSHMPTVDEREVRSRAA